MKQNSNKVRTLDTEISKVQIENFINDPESVMTESEIKEGKKETIKKALVIIAIILLSGLMIIFPNPITLIAGFSAIFGTGLALNIKHTNKMIDRIKNPPEAIINERILTKSGTDFYTENYRRVVETKQSEQKPQDKKTQGRSHLKVIDNEQSFLNKDETIAQINEEINSYYTRYTLPPLNVTAEDWTNYIDVLYNFFEQKQLESKFYNALSEINRFVFSKALVNKTTEIRINDFIENLYYLQNSLGSLKLNITKKELLNLEKEILSKIKNPEIINFEDYSNKSNRNK